MGDSEQEEAIAAASAAAEWHARREGLASSFERLAVAGNAAVASFVVDACSRMIVGLERARGDWDVLNSTVLGPDQRAFQSLRPGEHRTGRWTIIVGGLAPDDASSASITLAGDEHPVPVIDGLYLFAASREGDLKLERLPVSFVG